LNHRGDGLDCNGSVESRTITGPTPRDHCQL